MASHPTVTVAGKPVGRIGYGLMQLTWNPQAPSEETSFAAMKAAADAGSTCWSSASFYGNPGDNYANIRLLGRFFTAFPEYKDRIVLVVKGGVDHATLHPRGTDLEFLRTELKEMHGLLAGKPIDVFSLARLPDEGTVEDVFTGLVALQNEGLFGAIGASEMRAESLERASKITPIAINELEISLFTSDDAAIQAAVAWTTKTHTPTFAYSPLGRGFLTRQWATPDDIPEGSFQRFFPRFQGDAFYENLKLVDRVEEIAKGKGVTPSQVALAWIIQLSPYTIPIPGSSKPSRIAENAAAANITLSPDELASINDFLESFEVKGTRYPAQAMGHLMK